MGGIKTFLIKYFPSLGKLKRWLVAALDSGSANKSTYSQFGEDVFITEKLEEYDLITALYVDVGANHPTDISNTYLLYRKGYSGIVIEPNAELIGLFRTFRKRDIAMMIGCSNVCSILKFNISKTPVLSSFSGDRDNLNVYKQVYVPVLTLDAAMTNIECPIVSFLNIDVEGLNFQVLEGAVELLKRTLLLCIEFDTEEDKVKIKTILGDQFELINVFHCNLIFLNSKLSISLRHKAHQLAH
ncbi:MAG: FkbM family methyltransferase [Saprospiraceae bacterium]